jgi:hypothetical protein
MKRFGHSFETDERRPAQPRRNSQSGPAATKSQVAMFEGDFAVEDRPIDRDVERRAIAEKRFVQSSPVRVRIVTLPLSRWTCRR